MVAPGPAGVYLKRWRDIKSPSTLAVFEEQVDKDSLFCDSRPPAGAPALPAQAIRPGVSAYPSQHLRVHLLQSPLRIHASPPIFTTMSRQQAFGHRYGLPLPSPCMRTHTLNLPPPHTTHTAFGLIVDAMRSRELPSSDALRSAAELIGCCAPYYALEVRTAVLLAALASAVVGAMVGQRGCRHRTDALAGVSTLTHRMRCVVLCCCC